MNGTSAHPRAPPDGPSPLRSQSFPKSFLFQVTSAFWGFFLPAHQPWLRLAPTLHSVLSLAISALEQASNSHPQA